LHRANAFVLTQM